VTSFKPRPIKRFTDTMLFLGFARKLGLGLPADDRSPVAEIAHDRRQERVAVAVVEHHAMPFFTAATRELVVPRSMPTAMRCRWGSGDGPGSEICSSAMSDLETHVSSSASLSSISSASFS